MIGLKGNTKIVVFLCPAISSLAVLNYKIIRQNEAGELYLNKLLVDAKNHTSFIDRSRFYREHLTYKNRAT